MNILQVAPCYVDIYNETGGVANIVRQICLSLEKERINTVLICSNTELSKVVANEAIIKYSDYLTVHILSQHINPLLGPVKELRTLLKSINQVSLAHIHTCFSAITDYSVKYFINNNIPCVFTPHGKLSPAMFNNNKLVKSIYFNLINKKYLNLVNEIITSSNNEIKYLKSFGIKNTFSFIYNGYPEINFIKQEKNRWDLVPKSYLLFLGYLDPRKQPDLLIKAYANSKAVEKFKLVLAGPDSYGYQIKLEVLAKSLGLKIGDDIIFTGKVLGAEKWFLLKNARALLLPSKGEGWPVVIAEAIGANIPQVISEGCNFKEIEEMQLGIEVLDYSIESWTATIEAICFNESLYENFETGLSKYHSHFSWQFITKLWINKYLNIISNENEATHNN